MFSNPSSLIDRELGALVFGLKDKMLDGYAEVQASNMSKICNTVAEAEETVKLRSEQQG